MFRNSISSQIAANGPAIKGGCVTWRSIRAVSCYFSLEMVPVQARYGACFCCHGIKFIACWRNRGTIYISGRGIVPVTNVRNGQWSSFAVQCWSKPGISPGAGFKLGTLERCPGLTLIMDLSLEQERFAKTVTSNLPLLSVLAAAFIYYYQD